MQKGVNFAYFGTGNLSVIVLEELKKKSFLPKLIVTVPDKPQGRKMILTASRAKIWAQKENIPFLELDSLKNPDTVDLIKKYSDCYDLFLVVSYGKIIPKNILDIPKYKTLNLHPSILPKLRGASPIKSAILNEDETGVSIMRLDEELDHGPIVFQEKINIENWPPYEEDLEKILGVIGGERFAEIIPSWIEGKIDEEEQDHSLATFCGKIKKTDAEINLS
ncbi:MAG TPA: methionyl-tRNA formyltransferase, partial [Candidatus Paceibacterota bacterium]